MLDVRVSKTLQKWQSGDRTSLSDTILADKGTTSCPHSISRAQQPLLYFNFTDNSNKIFQEGYNPPPKKALKTHLRSVNDTINALLKHLDECRQPRMGPPLPLQVMHGLVKNYKNRIQFLT